jgi:hypothetical protein
MIEQWSHLVPVLKWRFESSPGMQEVLSEFPG